MEAIRTENVTLQVSDGTSMNAYVATPTEGAKAPGLLIFQEAFGVNAHIRDVTERFAREGYLAISPELFHRTAPGFEIGYTDMGPAFEQLRALTDAGLEADIRAAYGWLKSSGESQICATGYCMGGRTACLAALTVPLACSVSYYGGGIALNQFSAGLLDRLKDLNAPMANLPVVIFQFALSPYKNWQSLAWAGALLITLFVLLLSIIARLIASMFGARENRVE